jgi:hypothetical protein
MSTLKTTKRATEWRHPNINPQRMRRPPSSAQDYASIGPTSTVEHEPWVPLVAESQQEEQHRPGNAPGYQLGVATCRSGGQNFVTGWLRAS